MSVRWTRRRPWAVTASMTPRTTIKYLYVLTGQYVRCLPSATCNRTGKHASVSRGRIHAPQGRIKNRRMRNLLTSGQQSTLNNPEAIIDPDDPYGGRPVEVKLCYVPPEELKRSRELAQQEQEREQRQEQERAPTRRVPERHSRKCTVCNHPEREAIEEDFIHWHSPINIARRFNIEYDSSIYRHAHALGLFRLRKQNLRFVLENLMDRVDRVSITADSIIRAVMIYERIDERGKWIEPSAPQVAHSPVVTRRGLRIKRRKCRISNRKSRILKRGVTR